MQRQGNVSPTLLYFQVARLMAEILEENKWICYRGTPEQRADALALCDDCERVADRAWEKVKAIGERDELAARIIIDHFLMGMTWLDAASANGKSVDAAKKIAKAAMERYDEER